MINAEFEKGKKDNINLASTDLDLKKSASDFLIKSAQYKYSYNFTWLGRPIIQLPQDMIAMQEIIWQVRPDLIIETGIAHGGSIIFHASMLELLGGNSMVVGIDIDIRNHNREAIEKHPLFKRIKLIEGSSVDEKIITQVNKIAEGKEKILIILDSLHTHEHVLKELQLYSPMVTNGSYLIVLDTAIEDVPEDLFSDRPWAKGNNPKTAVWEFLKENDRFVIDKEIEEKLLITVAPDGYLKCIKE